jgi:hypothetical protein
MGASRGLGSATCQRILVAGQAGQVFPAKAGFREFSVNFFFENVDFSFRNKINL